MSDFNWQEQFKDRVGTAPRPCSTSSPATASSSAPAAASRSTWCGRLVEHSTHIYDAHVIHLLTMGAAPYADEKFREKFKMNTFFIAENVRDALPGASATTRPSSSRRSRRSSRRAASRWTWR